MINGTYGTLYYEHQKDIIISFLNDIVKLAKSETVLYCHNINFDGMLIVNSLAEKRIRFDWFIRELNIYWIDIYFARIKITLKCSYKIIPLSIKHIGEMLNMKKKIFPYKFACLDHLNYEGKCPPIEFFDDITQNDYLKFRNEFSYFNFKTISISYCLTDLKILSAVLNNIMRIIDSYDKRVIKTSFSFSAIAYKIYAKKFDSYGICSKKMKIDEYEYIKKSYFGGRCEVFGNPQKNEIIHYFDFSGMYAECMKNKFPVGKGTFKTTNLDVNEIGLHCVEIITDTKYPILPTHYNKKLLFPVGKFVGVFTHVELKYFIENGGQVLNLFSSYVFDKEENVFETYVQEFSQVRKKGVYYKIFGKAMNNGLYGSFGLNIENEEVIVVFNEEELHTYLSNTNVLSWKRLNNCIIIRVLKDDLSKKFLNDKNKWPEERRNLIYASYISSYARIKLHSGFREIINNGGRLYYCDTDSFFAGFKKNHLNETMGEITWSSIYDDAVFIAPKFYYLKKNETQSIKIKGVNSNVHSFDKIKTSFYNNEKNVLFANQLNFSKKNYELMQYYLEKNINMNNYDKRIFVNNKKDTVPMHVTDL